MAKVWRILLKKDIPTSPDYGEYCLKKKVAAMGWILEKHNSDIASGKIEINNFADFETYAKIEGMNSNQVRRFAEEIKPGDFIWTYVEGIYYLAQVAADSHYVYNADAEAIAYRACNQLTNIDWKAVGKYNDVDEKIAKRLQRGQALRLLFAVKNPDFAFGLQYTREVFGQKNLSVPKKFTHRNLSNNHLTKKFFEDVMFIHASASGAMGDAGVLEVWTKNFEKYECCWADDSFNVEKFHNAFLHDEDIPDFGTPKKNGWCFYYMGCGHNFYIREEVAETYQKHFGAEYGGEIFPSEEIMLKILKR